MRTRFCWGRRTKRLSIRSDELPPPAAGTPPKPHPEVGRGMTSPLVPPAPRLTLGSAVARWGARRASSCVMAREDVRSTSGAAGRVTGKEPPRSAQLGCASAPGAFEHPGPHMAEAQKEGVSSRLPTRPGLVCRSWRGERWRDADGGGKELDETPTLRGRGCVQAVSAVQLWESQAQPVFVVRSIPVGSRSCFYHVTWVL